MRYERPALESIQRDQPPLAANFAPPPVDYRDQTNLPRAEGNRLVPRQGNGPRCGDGAAVCAEDLRASEAGRSQ